MIAVSIYCYLTKYKAKQKHLLPFYVTYYPFTKMESKDELKEINIENRTCYYFHDIMRVKDVDFTDILLEEM